jgi:alpha-tubulin suppressor-like RCC1 family protein
MKNLIITLICLLLFQFLEAQNWQKISAGAEFSIALRSDGTLWSWGFNGNGQLGIDSDTLSIESPQQVKGGDDWLDVETGAFHCLAIKTDGTLWSWGLNGNGQLGIGNMAQQNAPVQIGTDEDWSKIEAGQAHSFAVKEDGTLWGWGFNTFGQIGNNTTADQKTPVQIGVDEDWWLIKAGGAHTIALKTDSTLWAWGANFNGQLGTGNTDNYLVPTIIDNNGDWIGIDTGFEFSLGIKDNGSLWSWGFNGNGQLGNGSTTEEHIPQQIIDTIGFVSISAGSAFGVAISDSHKLWAWGANLYGELGIGNNAQQNNPVKVGTDDDWQSISAAEGGATTFVFGFHTMGLRSSEEDICTTGANYIGQLGNGSSDSESTFSCNIGGGLVDASLLTLETEKIQFYPNPIEGNQFTIIQNTEESMLTLSDLSGKIWLSKKLTAKKQLVECSGLPVGAYVLTIQGDDGIFSDKLIKL